MEPEPTHAEALADAAQAHEDLHSSIDEEAERNENERQRLDELQREEASDYGDT